MGVAKGFHNAPKLYGDVSVRQNIIRGLTLVSGVFALTGYTLNGVYKEIQKLFGASVENYIMASRSTQGYEEWKIASLEERADVIRRWHILIADRNAGRF